MKFVQTPNFKLAVYSKGSENSAKLALVLPGRLDSKDYVHMTSHVDFLAKKGYYSLSFDMPGTWNSPGNIDDYTTTTYIKVVNELIKYFSNKPTLLLGHSRGGTTAMLAGAINENVKAIVAIMATYGAPISPSPDDLKAGVHITYRDLLPGSSRTVKKKKFLLPLSYFTDGKKYDPVAALKNFKGSKLLICGTYDKFISPEKVKDIYDSLPEPKMFLELNTDHDYRYHPDMIEAVNEKIGEFLEKYPL